MFARFALNQVAMASHPKRPSAVEDRPPWRLLNNPRLSPLNHGDNNAIPLSCRRLDRSPQARIFHFDASDVDKLEIGPENPVRHLHHKANSKGSGRAPEDQKFLEKVANSISDAGAILIVGPANEKDELVKQIKHSHPQMTIRIAGVGSADHPSDQELVAYARRYLESADLMRSQI